MPSRLACCALLALLIAAPAAKAGDLADFNAAAEAMAAHERVAIGYLRTGNADLAGLEIDALRTAWDKLTARFAGRRPDAFDGNPRYANLFTGVSARLVAADLMLKSGRPEQARAALIAVRDDFHDLRQASGIVVLADCVREAGEAFVALAAFDQRPLDTPQARFDLAAKSAVYGHVLAKCDAMAGEPVRHSPEFRRLIDGATASLRFVPQAVATGDTDLVHRVIGELRAFDDLLAFRYG